MEVQYVIGIAILAVIIGFLIGYLVGNRTKKLNYDGKLVIGEVEDRDQFQFIFSTELDDLINKDDLIMKIVNSKNSQSL